MEIYKYKKEGQDQYGQTDFEPFLKIDKDCRFVLDSKKDGDYCIRILPPWSAEGAFAKGFVVHYKVGLEKKHVICPNTVGDNICPFCAVHAQIRGDEMFAADDKDIRPVTRFISNIGDVKNPGKVGLIFEYGQQIYGPIKKTQDKGSFGDLFDVYEGRNLDITRTVRGKVTDLVLPGGSPSAILNPDWLDHMSNLDDGIIPDVDVKFVQKLFNSHPWKVYQPKTSTQRKVDNPPVSQPEVKSNNEQAPQQATGTAQPNDALARLRAKLEANKKAEPVAQNEQ